MSNLSLSENGKNFIKNEEGYCAKFYADPKGYPTVGWGTLITSDRIYAPKNTTGYAPDSALSQSDADALARELKLDYTSPISESKAQELFDEEISYYVKMANEISLPSDCRFSQSQFDAFVSLLFNCGRKVLITNDVKTLLKTHIIYPGFRGPMPGDESESLDYCSKIVSRAFSYDEGLQDRRNAEAELFCQGRKYTHKYPVYTVLFNQFF